MIRDTELRAMARQKRLALDVIEKDYVLGWILFGIASSTISNSLAFKGGTALSKVHFPGKWRLSEDLDFTTTDVTEMVVLGTAVAYEVPQIVKKACGIEIELKGDILEHPDYLRSKISYTGPISKNNIKIEISSEPFVGKVVRKSVPIMYDYPQFSVNVYSLDNLLAEKMRALVERVKIRDYYDVWRLLKRQKFDKKKVKELFLQKCKSKGVEFKSVDQIFPNDIVKRLDPYLKTGLTRLSPEPLPSLESITAELKALLKEFLS
jgi:predicted nucleotidyltransferase component of viral defense system